MPTRLFEGFPDEGLALGIWMNDQLGLMYHRPEGHVVPEFLHHRSSTHPLLQDPGHCIFPYYVHRAKFMTFSSFSSVSILLQGTEFARRGEFMQGNGTEDSWVRTRVE